MELELLGCDQQTVNLTDAGAQEFGLRRDQGTVELLSYAEILSLFTLD